MCNRFFETDFMYRFRPSIKNRAVCCKQRFPTGTLAQLASTARQYQQVYLNRDIAYTVADYRPFTVRLQLKTLLPCILLLSPAIKVQLR